MARIRAWRKRRYNFRAWKDFVLAHESGPDPRSTGSLSFRRRDVCSTALSTASCSARFDFYVTSSRPLSDFPASRITDLVNHKTVNYLTLVNILILRGEEKNRSFGVSQRGISGNKNYQEIYRFEYRGIRRSKDSKIQRLTSPKMECWRNCKSKHGVLGRL